MWLLALAAVAFTLYSCGGGKQSEGEESLDTYNAGKIRIAVDASFKPALHSEVFTFMKHYPNATILPKYTDEAEAVADLIADSARLVVLPRTLSPEEDKALRDQQMEPRTTPIAYDAVAVVIHRANSDSLFLYSTLIEILKGNVNRWKDIPTGKQHLQDSIRIVVDHPGSSTVKYLQDSILHIKKLPANYYSARGNQAVIDYVSTHKSAIGLVGLAWLSDGDDSTTSVFLKQVQVARVTNRDDGNTYYRPILTNLYGNYPLTRKVYIISREARMGLGSGFTSFVAGEIGQRILLKSDLRPAYAVIRLIEPKKSFDP